MDLTSRMLVHNGQIQLQFANASAGGRNISPPLEWKRAPKETKSFVLTVTDPDVPWGEEVPVYGPLPPPGTCPCDLLGHWLVANIPVSVGSLPEGVNPSKMSLGAIELRAGFAEMLQAQDNKYQGPAPPPGLRAHRYDFTVYALDVEWLSLTAKSDYAALMGAMAGHVLATATLSGYFSRKP